VKIDVTEIYFVPRERKLLIYSQTFYRKSQSLNHFRQMALKYYFRSIFQLVRELGLVKEWFLRTYFKSYLVMLRVSRIKFCFMGCRLLVVTESKDSSMLLEDTRWEIPQAFGFWLVGHRVIKNILNLQVDNIHRHEQIWSMSGNDSTVTFCFAEIFTIWENADPKLQ